MTKIFIQNEKSYTLLGTYTKDTIPLYQEEIDKAFTKTAPEIIYLHQFDRCDSALVALLLDWKKRYPRLQLQKPKEMLYKLLMIYHVEALLLESL